MERAEEIFSRVVANGENAIDDFILNRESEELFLDFKRSSDDGRNRNLSQTDRNNLAKAISGFGNSEGGVIVWGIDCSHNATGGDVAKCKVPVVDAKRFKSWLEGAVSGCTVPPHSGVRNAAILCTGSADGFVVTHIPKSNHAPHQMVGKLQYYIRAGSDFVPTPHQVLAGMFGRRPQPHVYPMFLVDTPVHESKAIKSELGFVIRNDGPGLATNLFLNVMVASHPGDNTTIALQPLDLTRWSAVRSFGCHVSLLSNTEIKLPPEAQIQPLKLLIALSPPFTRNLELEALVGADNCPPYRFQFKTEPEKLAQVYDHYRKTDLSDQEQQQFLGRVFSIPDEPAWQRRQS